MLDIGKLKGCQLGSYHLDEKLGQGSFGAVYRANVVVGGRIIASPVAVKAIDPAHLDRKSPLRELENAATLKHRHLIEVIGHPGEASVVDATGASGTVYWFAMELATETLEKRLGYRGLLSEAEARDMIQRIGGALAWLHERKLVHRDVKPGNILNVGGVWKLGDFGLTRKAVDGYYSSPKGTKLYLPPEHEDDPAPKPSWDVWALGITAVEAVTGAHPKGTLPMRQWSEILANRAPLPLPTTPEWLIPLARGCLEKEPQMRWAAAVAVQSAGSTGKVEGPVAGHGGGEPANSAGALFALNKRIREIVPICVSKNCEFLHDECIKKIYLHFLCLTNTNNKNRDLFNKLNLFDMIAHVIDILSEIKSEIRKSMHRQYECVNGYPESFISFRASVEAFGVVSASLICILLTLVATLFGVVGGIIMITKLLKYIFS